MKINTGLLFLLNLADDDDYQNDDRFNILIDKRAEQASITHPELGEIYISRVHQPGLYAAVIQFHGAQET